MSIFSILEIPFFHFFARCKNIQHNYRIVYKEIYKTIFCLMNNVSILHFQLYKDQSTILDLKNNTPRMYMLVKNIISQVNV